MKTLLIIGIILAILAVYFVLKTEKSISVEGGGGGVITAGVDIPKFILSKFKNIIPNNTTENIIDNIKNKKLNNITESNLTDKIKSKIGDIKDKIVDGSINLIKDPIKNKLNEVICNKD